MRALTCRCETGGTLRSRKGINLPDTNWRGASLTDKDRDDAAWAARRGLDYIAFSFVRSREDVEQLRQLLDELRRSRPHHFEDRDATRDRQH